MDIVFALADHPVYGSLRKVLLGACNKADGKLVDNFHDVGRNTRVIIGDNRLFFKKTDLRFSRENLHVLNSPLVSLETWEALVGGHKALIAEEYYKKSGLKDLAASSALSPFRGYPFVSHTKRTHEFLSKRGFGSVLIPPALKKTEGDKKRKFFLYVGKMIPSKNPLFFLEMAKRMGGEEFVMVGDGPMLPEVRRMANETGNVEVIERVDREDLFSRYYPKAKALIHPTFKDPVGFVVIEALSCSTPVVASVNVGTSDYLPEEWRMEGYGPGEWVDRAISAGNDAKKAGEVFEKENLNLESPFFDEVAEKLSGILQNKGWLTLA